MRRIYFLVILLLILAIFLSSCGGLLTPDMEWVTVKGVVQNYALALNSQDWDKAKDYCIYNSDAYFMVETYEFYINFHNIEIFTFEIDEIKDIEVEGSYARAYIHTVATIGSWSEYIGLQKVDDDWKIYYNSYVIFRIK